MAILVTIITAIVGWFVIYKINSHFNNKNQKKTDITSLISKLEEIQHISLLFWLDTNHVSTFADQQQLINKFKLSRLLIAKICPNNSQELIDLMRNAQKSLTNTPPSVTDFSTMNKSSLLFNEIYEKGNKSIQELITKLNKIE